MQKVIIIRYSEIHLKGQNRKIFENIFLQNIKQSLKNIQYNVIQIKGRYIIENFDDNNTELLLEKVKNVFGAHTISLALEVKTTFDDIYLAICKLLAEQQEKQQTFKIITNRADKTFPFTSMELSQKMGAKILSTFSYLSVDVHHPNCSVFIDIRENGKTYLYLDAMQAVGGLPIGCSGKGILLLSGGIDSPVAGYMTAKRGMKMAALHFHSYPYTNIQAKQKVEDLAKILSTYTNGLQLYAINLAKIQESIYKNCPNEMMITLLRRFMMRIAKIFCEKIGAQAIVTGENLGQVASQTIEGITSSNAVVGDLPILRPLIGFDKVEIIDRAKKIGTYDTSILPYEDCCTVFLPKHPLIKPKLTDVERAESKLSIEQLIDEALQTMEIIEF